LLSSVADPDPHADSREAPLDGNVPSPTDPPSGCRFHTRCPEFIGDVCRKHEPEYHGVGEGRESHCHLHAEDQTSPEGSLVEERSGS
jgi:oligopeptide/dipeptide ABC transporter ATP-binding protein